MSWIHLTNQIILKTFIIFKILKNINANTIKAGFFLIISYIVIFTEIEIAYLTILDVKKIITKLIDLVVSYIY